MTHLKFSYYPICGHYHVNGPERVSCDPNPESCRVCNNPRPEFRGKEVVNVQDPSASCGLTNCRNAMDQRIHAGNYHTAAGGFDASNARTAGYNDASQVRYAPMGHGFLRTSDGFMTQEQYAAGSSAAASSSKTGGKDGKWKKEEKGKGKEKEKEKEKEKGKEKAKEKERAKEKDKNKKKSKK